MLLILRYAVRLSLVGYMATDAKCVQHVFEVCKLTTSTKMSFLEVHCNALKIGYNRKHIHINDKINLLFFPDAFKDANGDTMPLMVTATIDLTIFSC